MQFPKEYVNASGFVTVEPNEPDVPGAGNGWLQTGLAIACGYTELLERVPEMLSRCRENETSPLIFRSPYKKNIGDDEQADDYYGALPLSEAWAKEVLAYGEEHCWLMDIQGTGSLNYWFGRFPGFPSFVRLCAGEDGHLDRLSIAGNILVSSFFLGSASGNMKAFCIGAAAAKRSKLCVKAFDLWKRRAVAKYGSIGLSWAAYFGPDHPLSNYKG